MRPLLVFTVIINCISIRIQAQLLTNPVVEKIADGFQFVEGPVWNEGVGLFFSDIPANTVYFWNEWDAAVPFLEPSGNSNGLAFDTEGKLLLAQHGPRQIARLENDMTIVPLATHYDGKRLNSPNDLALHTDGSIFFTDPPYGLNDQGGISELGYYGIFRLSPSGSVQLLDSSLDRPNGIAFSPDEIKLYVSDSETRRIYVWDVVDDSTLTNKQLFAYMEPAGYADGMKVDPEGYLYVAGPIGIWIFHPDGTVIDAIPVPGQTSNCAWGGDDGKTLYVTSGNAVYKIYNDTDTPDGAEVNKDNVRSFQSYPNPFTETTQMSIYLEKPGNIHFTIYDLRGMKIVSLFHGYMDQGIQQFKWNAAGIRNGVYLVRTQFGNSPADIFRISKY